MWRSLLSCVTRKAIFTQGEPRVRAESLLMRKDPSNLIRVMPAKEWEYSVMICVCSPASAFVLPLVRDVKQQGGQSKCLQIYRVGKQP